MLKQEGLKRNLTWLEQYEHQCEHDSKLFAMKFIRWKRMRDEIGSDGTEIADSDA